MPSCADFWIKRMLRLERRTNLSQCGAAAGHGAIEIYAAGHRSSPTFAATHN
jgi:hypothetical protein